MPGGAYSALTGMRSKLEELDRLAADLANVNTAGYKVSRTSNEAKPRDAFGVMLEAAVDVATTQPKTDFHQGVIAPTNRDLDVAIDGAGFFSIETPAGTRYTRDGAFTRGSDGTLVTADGFPVLGTSGPIRLGRGSVAIDDGGTIRVGGAVAGQIALVDIPTTGLIRESGSRFRAAQGVESTPATSRVVGGALEGSNISVVDRIVALTEVKRGFEFLQKGISTLYNDMDGRAIAELGRR